MPVTVVIITRDRARSLQHTLERLAALPERPPVVVVDNGSSDETPRVVASAGVQGVRLQDNAGAAGRNVGVSLANTPYVAFSDDDSWWAPGALVRALAYFERHPRLGLLAGRTLVGRDGKLDPLSSVMRRSPLGQADDLPGRNVLGFAACSAVVRRLAFLQAGGFHPRFEVGGEETLLAIDLALRGWGVVYCDDVIAHHHPEPGMPRAGRRARMLRNRLWTAWLRRPSRAALAATAAAAREALGDPGGRAGLVAALRGLPWVLRERRPVSGALERQATLVLR